MNNKIATVVVTFNRKDSLLKNIKLLINQTTKIDKIFIIDNASTDGTYEILNENEILKRKDIEYIRLEENLGGSAGFYEGIKLAYEKKYDWIWGMDDDAYPNKNALQQLISMSVKYPDIKCFWSNCNNDNLFDIEVKDISLIDDELFEKILEFNRMIPSWRNLQCVYNKKDIPEVFLNYIINNLGKI